MPKLALTALATAAVSFAVAAATGLGAGPKVLTMTPGEVISLTSDNFHCQAVTKTQVACGANSLPNSTQVYFAPHQLAVLKFNKAGTKAAVIFSAKR